MSARKTYVPSGEGCSRSPCPALNALANHSYIPHDGRNIPFFQLVNAMRIVYRCSAPLALFLTVVGFVTCGHFEGSWFSLRYKLDLHDLARHGRIEHDGSLGHGDAKPGDDFAPVTPDRGLITQLIDAAFLSPLSPQSVQPLSIQSGRVRQPRPKLNFYDICHARYLRDREMAKKLDPLHAEITTGEVALMFQSFADSHGEVPAEWIRQWFEEERLPEGWTSPREQIGLLKTANLGKKVKKETTRLARSS